MEQADTSHSLRLSTAFELNIGAPILPDRVAAGRFLRSTVARSRSGAVSSTAPPPAVTLAFGSSGQRVLLHDNNVATAEAKRSARRGEAQASAGSASAATAVADGSTVQTLNFGKTATALAAAPRWGGDGSHDALLFGASTSLLAYDVELNKQLFYTEVEDGVQAVVCGGVQPSAKEARSTNTTGSSPVAAAASALAVVGGNCSLFGFDRAGAERYWTVTGDQVTAMALLPWDTTRINNNSRNGSAITDALVVASEDFEVRAYTGEEVMVSIQEVDAVRKLVPLYRPPYPSDSGGLGDLGDGTALAPLPPPEQVGRFAYLLKNGTVGVYDHDVRAWRVKGKSTPVSAAFCDVDGDGVAELVIGWSSGRVEVRTDRTNTSSGSSGGGGGAVLFRESYDTAVAAILTEDYRHDGQPLPIVCTVDGNVRGLRLLEERRAEAAEIRQLQQLEALTHEQQRLTAELAGLVAQLEEQAALAEERGATMSSASGNTITSPPPLPPPVIVKCSCRTNAQTRQVELHVSMSGPAGEAVEGAVVHSCLLRCETWGTAEAPDTIAFSEAEKSSSLVCAFEHPHDVPLMVSAMVAIGSPFAEAYAVREVEVPVPRFILYHVCTGEAGASPTAVAFLPASPAYVRPSGAVTLTWRTPLDLAAIEKWVRTAFWVPDAYPLLNATAGGSALLLELVHLRDGSSLSLECTNSATNGDADGHGGAGQLTLRSDLLAPCAEVLQGMQEDMKGSWTEGPSDAAVTVRCEIPAEMERLRGLLASVDAFNEVRVKLTTDMADAAAIVKTLLGRAEDARLLGEVPAMKKFYAALYDVDQELLGENAKRLSNYEELKTALKEVNTYIQNAGKLRMGTARAQLIADCRNALKENKVNALLEIIRCGSE